MVIVMVNAKDSALTYGRGYVYKIQYHVVWCVKYRRKVIIDDVEQSLKKRAVGNGAKFRSPHFRNGMHARPYPSAVGLLAAALHPYNN